MILESLLAALRAAGSEPTGEMIADALWMLQHLPDAAPRAEPVCPAPEQPPAARSDGRAPPDRPGQQREQIAQPPSPQPGAAGPSEEAALPIYPRNGAPAEPMGQLGAAINTPGAPALADTIELARALRPLARRVPSRTSVTIDENETARRMAEERIFVPVLRPARTRWLALHVVVDQSSSMVLWRKVCDELCRLLMRLGAFRNVRLWSLRANTPDAPPTLAPLTKLAAGQSTVPLKMLVDPSGRSLILVVSDCVAPGWRSGAVARVLEDWGRSDIVAVIQMLPERLWERSCLGRELDVRLHSAAPGAPNAQLKAAFPAARIFGRRGKPRGAYVPVAVLDPASLRSWASMVTGMPNAWVPGYLLATAGRPAPAGAPDRPDGNRSLGTARVERFLAHTSPLGVDLAKLLAAAPVITLPIIRLIQRTMLPGSGQSHVAEVFLGGLLRPIVGSEDSEMVLYDFIDDARTHLLNMADHAAVERIYVQMYQHVSDYIAKHLGSDDRVQAVAPMPPDVLGQLPAAAQQAFASASLSVLRSLGYRDLADALGKEWGRPPTVQLSPSTSLFRQGHGLVIGVGPWRGMPTRNAELTAREASIVAVAMCDPSGARYPASQVRLLTEEAATREQIMAELRRLAAVAAEDDTVLFFYSGQWLQDEDQQPCLTTHDSSIDAHQRVRIGTGIGYRELAHAIAQVRARNILMIFSGSSPAVLAEVSAALVKTGGNRMVLTDRQAGSLAYWRPDESTPVFARILAETLHGRGVPNRNGYISVFDLFAQVLDRVRRTAERNPQQRQEPELFLLQGAEPFPVALHRESGQAGVFAAPRTLQVQARTISLTSGGSDGAERLTSLLSELAAEADALRSRMAGLSDIGAIESVEDLAIAAIHIRAAQRAHARGDHTRFEEKLRQIQRDLSAVGFAQIQRLVGELSGSTYG